MKITGKELQEWINHGWPGDDWYWEHDLFEIEPIPTEIYDTSEIDGLFYQGKDPDQRDLPSIDAMIRKWRKSRDYVVIVIDCPKSVESEVRDYLRSKGIKTS